MEELKVSEETIALVEQFAKEKNDIICGFLKEKEIMETMHKDEMKELVATFELEKDFIRKKFELEKRDLLQVEKQSQHDLCERKDLEGKSTKEVASEERKAEIRYKEEKVKIRHEFEQVIAAKNEEIKILRRTLLREEHKQNRLARNSPDNDVYIKRTEHKEEIRSFAENFKTEKLELQRKLDREKAQLVQVFANQTELMSANFDEEKKRMQEEHQKELQLKLEVAERLHDEKSDHDNQRMLEQFEHEIRELQESLDKDYNDRILEQQEIIENLEKQKNELLNALQTERFSLARLYNREVSLLAKTDQLNKADIEVSLLDEIAKLKQHYEDAMTEAEEQYKQKINEINSNQTPRRELEQQHRKEVEKLKKDFQHEKGYMDAEFRKEQLNLLKSFEFERNDVEQRYKVLLREGEAEIQQREEDLRRIHEEELGDLKSIVLKQREELEISKEKLTHLADQVDEFVSERNRLEEKIEKERSQCQTLEQTIENNIQTFQNNMNEVKAFHQKQLARKVEELSSEKEKTKRVEEEKRTLQKALQTLNATLENVQETSRITVEATNDPGLENSSLGIMADKKIDEIEWENTNMIEEEKDQNFEDQNILCKGRDQLNGNEDDYDPSVKDVEVRKQENNQGTRTKKEDQVTESLLEIREKLNQCILQEEDLKTSDDFQMSNKKMKDAINEVIMEIDNVHANQGNDENVIMEEEQRFSIQAQIEAVENILTDNDDVRNIEKATKNRLNHKMKEILMKVHMENELEKLRMKKEHQEGLSAVMKELANETGKKVEELSEYLENLQQQKGSTEQSEKRPMESRGSLTNDSNSVHTNPEISKRRTKKDASNYTDVVGELKRENKDLKRSIEELGKNFKKEKEDLMEKLQTQHKEFVMSTEDEVIEHLLKEKSNIEEAFNLERFYLSRLYYLEMKEEIEGVLFRRRENMKQEFERDKMNIILKYESDISDLHKLLSEKGEMELKLLHDRNQVTQKLLAAQKRESGEKGNRERKKEKEKLEREKGNLEITIPLKKEIADLQKKRHLEHETSVANLKEAIDLIKEIISSTSLKAIEDNHELDRLSFLSEDPESFVGSSPINRSNEILKRLDEEIRNKEELQDALENLVEILLNKDEDIVYDSDTTSGASSDLESDYSDTATTSGETDEGAFSGPESNDGEMLSIKKEKLDFVFNVERFNLGRVYYGEYRDSLQKAMRKLAKAREALRSKKKDLENDMLHGFRSLVQRTNFGNEYQHVSTRDVDTQTMVENSVKDEADGVADDELTKTKEASIEVLTFSEVDDGLSDFNIKSEGCKVTEGASILNEERPLFTVPAIPTDELNEDLCEESEHFIGKRKQEEDSCGKRDSRSEKDQDRKKDECNPEDENSDGEGQCYKEEEEPFKKTGKQDVQGRNEFEVDVSSKPEGNKDDELENAKDINEEQPSSDEVRVQCTKEMKPKREDDISEITQSEDGKETKEKGTRERVYIVERRDKNEQQEEQFKQVDKKTPTEGETILAKDGRATEYKETSKEFFVRDAKTPQVGYKNSTGHESWRMADVEEKTLEKDRIINDTETMDEIDHARDREKAHTDIQIQPDREPLGDTKEDVRGDANKVNEYVGFEDNPQVVRDTKPPQVDDKDLAGHESRRTRDGEEKKLKKDGITDDAEQRDISNEIMAEVDHDQAIDSEKPHADTKIQPDHGALADSEEEGTRDCSNIVNELVNFNDKPQIVLKNSPEHKSPGEMKEGEMTPKEKGSAKKGDKTNAMDKTFDGNEDVCHLKKTQDDDMALESEFQEEVYSEEKTFEQDRIPSGNRENSTEESFDEVKRLGHEGEMDANADFTAENQNDSNKEETTTGKDGINNGTEQKQSGAVILEATGDVNGNAKSHEERNSSLEPNSQEDLINDSRALAEDEITTDSEGTDSKENTPIQAKDVNVAPGKEPQEDMISSNHKPGEDANEDQLQQRLGTDYLTADSPIKDTGEDLSEEYESTGHLDQSQAQGGFFEPEPQEITFSKDEVTVARIEMAEEDTTAENESTVDAEDDQNDPKQKYINQQEGNKQKCNKDGSEATNQISCKYMDEETAREKQKKDGNDNLFYEEPERPSAEKGDATPQIGLPEKAASKGHKPTEMAKLEQEPTSDLFSDSNDKLNSFANSTMHNFNSMDDTQDASQGGNLTAGNDKENNNENDSFWESCSFKGDEDEDDFRFTQGTSPISDQDLILRLSNNNKMLKGKFDLLCGIVGKAFVDEIQELSDKHEREGSVDDTDSWSDLYEEKKLLVNDIKEIDVKIKQLRGSKHDGTESLRLKEEETETLDSLEKIDNELKERKEKDLLKHLLKEKEDVCTKLDEINNVLREKKEVFGNLANNDFKVSALMSRSDMLKDDAAEKSREFKHKTKMLEEADRVTEKENQQLKKSLNELKVQIAALQNSMETVGDNYPQEAKTFSKQLPPEISSLIAGKRDADQNMIRLDKKVRKTANNIELYEKLLEEKTKRLEPFQRKKERLENALKFLVPSATKRHQDVVGDEEGSGKDTESMVADFWNEGDTMSLEQRRMEKEIDDLDLAIRKIEVFQKLNRKLSEETTTFKRLAIVYEEKRMKKEDLKILNAKIANEEIDLRKAGIASSKVTEHLEKGLIMERELSKLDNSPPIEVATRKSRKLENLFLLRESLDESIRKLEDEMSEEQSNFLLSQQFKKTGELDESGSKIKALTHKKVKVLTELNETNETILQKISAGGLTGPHEAFLEESVERKLRLEDERDKLQDKIDGETVRAAEALAVLAKKKLALNELSKASENIDVDADSLEEAFYNDGDFNNNNKEDQDDDNSRNKDGNIHERMSVRIGQSAQFPDRESLSIKDLRQKQREVEHVLKEKAEILTEVKKRGKDSSEEEDALEDAVREKILVDRRLKQVLKEKIHRKEREAYHEDKETYPGQVKGESSTESSALKDDIEIGSNINFEDRLTELHHQIQANDDQLQNLLKIVNVSDDQYVRKLEDLKSLVFDKIKLGDEIEQLNLLEDLLNTKKKLETKSSKTEPLEDSGEQKAQIEIELKKLNALIKLRLKQMQGLERRKESNEEALKGLLDKKEELDKRLETFKENVCKVKKEAENNLAEGERIMDKNNMITYEEQEALRREVELIQDEIERISKEITEVEKDLHLRKKESHEQSRVMLDLEQLFTKKESLREYLAEIDAVLDSSDGDFTEKEHHDPVKTDELKENKRALETKLQTIRDHRAMVDVEYEEEAIWEEMKDLEQQKSDLEERGRELSEQIRDSRILNRLAENANEGDKQIPTHFIRGILFEMTRDKKTLTEFIKEQQDLQNSIQRQKNILADEISLVMSKVGEDLVQALTIPFPSDNQPTITNTYESILKEVKDSDATVGEVLRDLAEENEELRVINQEMNLESETLRDKVGEQLVKELLTPALPKEEMESGDALSVMNEDGKSLASILQEQTGKIDTLKDTLGHELFNSILWTPQKPDVEEKSASFSPTLVAPVIMKHFDEDLETVIAFYEKELDHISQENEALKETLGKDLTQQLLGLTRKCQTLEKAYDITPTEYLSRSQNRKVMGGAMDENFNSVLHRKIEDKSRQFANEGTSSAARASKRETDAEIEIGETIQGMPVIGSTDRPEFDTRQQLRGSFKDDPSAKGQPQEHPNDAVKTKFEETDLNDTPEDISVQERAKDIVTTLFNIYMSHLRSLRETESYVLNDEEDHCSLHALNIIRENGVTLGGIISHYERELQLPLQNKITPSRPLEEQESQLESRIDDGSNPLEIVELDKRMKVIVDDENELKVLQVPRETPDKDLGEILINGVDEELTDGLRNVRDISHGQDHDHKKPEDFEIFKDDYKESLGQTSTEETIGEMETEEKVGCLLLGENDLDFSRQSMDSVLENEKHLNREEEAEVEAQPRGLKAPNIDPQNNKTIAYDVPSHEEALRRLQYNLGPNLTRALLAMNTSTFRMEGERGDKNKELNEQNEISIKENGDTEFSEVFEKISGNLRNEKASLTEKELKALAVMTTSKKTLEDVIEDYEKRIYDDFAELETEVILLEEKLGSDLFHALLAEDDEENGIPQTGEPANIASHDMVNPFTEAEKDDVQPCVLKARSLIKDEGKTVEDILRKYETQLRKMTKLPPNDKSEGVLNRILDFEDKISSLQSKNKDLEEETETLEEKLSNLEKIIGQDLFRVLDNLPKDAKTDLNTADNMTSETLTIKSQLPTGESEDAVQPGYLKAKSLILDDGKTVEDILRKYETQLEEMKKLLPNKKGDDASGIDLISARLESKDDDLKEENNTLGQKLKKLEKIMGQNPVVAMDNLQDSEHSFNDASIDLNVTHEMKNKEEAKTKLQLTGGEDENDAHPNDLKAESLTEDEGKMLENIQRKHESQPENSIHLLNEKGKGAAMKDFKSDYEHKNESPTGRNKDLEKENETLIEKLANLEKYIGQDLFCVLDNLQDKSNSSNIMETDLEAVRKIKGEDETLEDVLENYERELIALRILVPRSVKESSSLTDVEKEHNEKIEELLRQNNDLKSVLHNLQDKIGSNLYDDLTRLIRGYDDCLEIESTNEAKISKKLWAPNRMKEEALTLEDVILSYEQDLQQSKRVNDVQDGQGMKGNPGDVSKKKRALSKADVGSSGGFPSVVEGGETKALETKRRKSEDEDPMQQSENDNAANANDNSSHPCDRNNSLHVEARKTDFQGVSLISNEGITTEAAENETEVVTRLAPSDDTDDVSGVVKRDRTIESLNEENDKLLKRMKKLEHRIGRKLLREVEHKKPQDYTDVSDNNSAEHDETLRAVEIMLKEERPLEDVIKSFERQLDVPKGSIHSEGKEGFIITASDKKYEDTLVDLRMANDCLWYDLEKLKSIIGHGLVKEIMKLPSVADETKVTLNLQRSKPGSDLKITKIMDVKQSTLEDVLETYESALGTLLSDTWASSADVETETYNHESCNVATLKQENDILKKSIGVTLSQSLLKIAKDGKDEADLFSDDTEEAEPIDPKDSPAIKERIHIQRSSEELRAETMVREEGRTIENILKNYEKELESIKALVLNKSGQTTDMLSDLVRQYEDQIDEVRNENRKFENRLLFLEDKIGSNLINALDNQQDGTKLQEYISQSELNLPLIMKKEDTSLEAVIRRYEKEIKASRELDEYDENQLSISDTAKECKVMLTKEQNEKESLKTALNHLEEKLGPSLVEDIKKLADKTAVKLSDEGLQLSEKQKELKATNIMREEAVTLESVLERYEDELYNIAASGEQINVDNMKRLTEKVGLDLVNELLQPKMREMGRTTRWEAVEIIKEEEKTLADIIESYESDLDRFKRERGALEALENKSEDTEQSVLLIISQYEDEIQRLKGTSKERDNKLSTLFARLGDNLTNEVLSLTPCNGTGPRSSFKAVETMANHGKKLSDVIKQYEIDLESLNRVNEALKVSSGDQSVEGKPFQSVISEYEMNMKEMLFDKQKTESTLIRISGKVGESLIKQLINPGEEGQGMNPHAIEAITNDGKTLAHVLTEYEEEIERLQKESRQLRDHASEDSEASSLMEKVAMYEVEILNANEKIKSQTNLQKKVGIELSKQLMALSESVDQESKQHVFLGAVEIMKKDEYLTLADVVKSYEEELEKTNNEMLALKELISGNMLEIATSQESEIYELKKVNMILARELESLSNKIGQELSDELLEKSAGKPPTDNVRFYRELIHRLENDGKQLQCILHELDLEIKLLRNKNEELNRSRKVLEELSGKIGNELYKDLLKDNDHNVTQATDKPPFQASELMYVKQKNLGDVILSYEKDLAKLKRENVALRELAERETSDDSSMVNVLSNYEEKIEKLESENGDLHNKMHKLTKRVGQELSQQLLKLPDEPSASKAGDSELNALTILEEENSTLMDVLRAYENMLRDENEGDNAPMVSEQLPKKEEIKFVQLISVAEFKPNSEYSAIDYTESTEARIKTLIKDNANPRERFERLSGRVDKELSEELMRSPQEGITGITTTNVENVERDLMGFDDVIAERTTLLRSRERNLQRKLKDDAGQSEEGHRLEEETRSVQFVPAENYVDNIFETGDDETGNQLKVLERDLNSEKEDNIYVCALPEIINENVISPGEIVLEKPEQLAHPDESFLVRERKQAIEEQIVQVHLSKHEDSFNVDFVESLFAADAEMAMHKPETEHMLLENLDEKVKELERELEDEKALNDRYQKDVQDLLKDIVDLKMKQVKDDDENPEERRNRMQKDRDLRQDNKRLEEDLRIERKRRLSSEESKRDLIDEVNNLMKQKAALIKQGNEHDQSEKLLEDMINLRKKIGELTNDNNSLNKKVTELKDSMEKMEVLYKEQRRQLLADFEKEKSLMVQDLVGSKQEVETQLKELLVMNEDLKGTIKTLLEQLNVSHETLAREGENKIDNESEWKEKKNRLQDMVNLLNESRERPAIKQTGKSEHSNEHLDDTEHTLRESLKNYEDETKSIETQKAKREAELQKGVDILTNKLETKSGLVEQTREDFDNLFQREIDRLKEDMDLTLEMEKENLRLDFEQKEDDLKKQGSVELLQREEEWNREREELQELFRTEKEKLQKAFDQELEKRISEELAGFAQERRELRETVERRLYEKLIDENLTAETDFQELLSRILQEHSKEIESVENDIRKAEERFQDEKNRLKEKSDEQKDILKKSYEEEKRALQVTVQDLLKEVIKLKNQRKEIRLIHKKDKETIEENYEKDIMKLKEDWEHYKRELLGKLQDDFDTKLADETRKLEAKMEDMKRELEKSEQRRKEVEKQLLETKSENERDKFHEGSSCETDTDNDGYQKELKFVKKTLEEEYDKKLTEEKRRFEEILQSLRHEIGSLQEKRRLIQDKIYSQDPTVVDRQIMEKSLANYKMEMLSKMEEEVAQKVAREKEPLEEAIDELQQQVDDLKRQRWELRNQVRKERARMEEEFENERENMQKQFLKEKEELKSNLDSRMQKEMTKMAAENKVSRALSPIYNVSDNDNNIYTISIFLTARATSLSVTLVDCHVLPS